MDNQKYLKSVSTLEYDASKCIACKMCVEVCPHNVFTMKNNKAVITNKDKCMECGACARNCLGNALSVEQGVGCATAVIWGFFKGTEPNCDCSPDTGKACCN